MFSVKKSKNIPKSLSNNKYDGDDVHEQLAKDFYNKCYICGGLAEAREIEHFIPKSVEESKKYDWGNLFLSCGYCNSRKSTIFNKNGKDILDCTKEKIENHIEHRIMPFRGATPKFHKLIDNSKVNNTIELIEKVYSNDGSIRQKLENKQRREKAIEEIMKFQEAYNDFYEILDEREHRNYEKHRDNLIKHFEKKSLYREFKIGFLETEEVIKETIMKLLEEEKIEL